MSRQLEIVSEEKETKRRRALVRALEFELPGVLETQGIQLAGFSVRYDAFDCLLTIRAVVGGNNKVAHIGGDSVINCILRAVDVGRAGRLRWKDSKYK